VGSPGKAIAARAAAAVSLAALALSLALAAAGCASKPPALAQEWYDIGNVWLDKKDWKKASSAYERALELDAKFPGASFNLARALAEQGDYEGALKCLDALVKQDPDNVRVASARAYVLYKLGEKAAALEAYRKVLDQDPYAPDAVYNMSVLELAAGDAAGAATHLEQLSLASPDDAQVLLSLGKARDKSGDPKGALDAFERAKILGKADAATLERIGELYEADRSFKEAMEAYEAAVKAETGRAKSWFALARLRLVVAADSEQGLAALKKALDAGFSDKEAAVALMDDPDLAEREKAHDLLKAKGLVE
jgi:tetratricopeptide (TPR) repeat protein